ncbi:unnamed protein product [Dovyalis caffra]|uniref:Uncharacterized protein n=1 Tax=Dovyalis caffra TaxID=77055 RepID=A0AAV1RH37_9ROSI|nr:unnamed protein product [Dovyalis caffra]
MAATRFQQTVQEFKHPENNLILETFDSDSLKMWHAKTILTGKDSKNNKSKFFAATPDMTSCSSLCNKSSICYQRFSL